MKEYLINLIEDTLTNLTTAYVHRNMPIIEEAPFNIEYNIGRYHALMDVLEHIDKPMHDFIYKKCETELEEMSNFVDSFIDEIKED